MHTRFWMDGDTLVEQRTVDVEPHLEHAKRMRSLGMVGSSEMRCAAVFPPEVIENYIARAGITLHDFLTDTAHVRRMLNDPDLAGFRHWQGRI